jgi:hypothetical protein
MGQVVVVKFIRDIYKLKLLHIPNLFKTGFNSSLSFPVPPKKSFSMFASYGIDNGTEGEF